ncbi:MAG: glycosyltransferase family 2 protein [Bacteroidaceae bacterium]|nr:glycosyltransferase family 2 protein [Bacteroidaceae bacterium]
MKLSILIPTYNHDVSRLVHDLQEQLPEDAEIIVGDDSPPHNIGRAARRNALAREAKGEWLLFIDADAEVRSKTFISDYLAAVHPSFGRDGGGSLVVCGGTGNLPECPRPAARLRYDYEVANEKRFSLSHRRKHPYAQFTTFNFLIQRNLFLSIGFDESLKEYGHEDTLFGLELKRRGIAIHHIDNKLTHLGLEDADEYLTKVETALRTLASMDIEQRKNVRVSAFALRLKRLHLLGLMQFLFRTGKPMLRANLLGRHPSQLLFTFYKLGFYADNS